MVSLFSLPDPEVLSESSGTVYLCEPMAGSVELVVIPVTAIHSVVSMFPELQVSLEGHIIETGKVSLMRHPYIELVQFSDNGVFEGDDES